jgi:hypothetical protein
MRLRRRASAATAWPRDHSALPLLKNIAADTAQTAGVRESAATIFAIHDAAASLPLLQQLADAGSWYAKELHRIVREFGEINPKG